jgi:hypothetical protein
MSMRAHARLLMAILASACESGSSGAAGDASVVDAATVTGPADAARDLWGPPVACPRDPNRAEPCLRNDDTCTVDGACCLCQVVSACAPILLWTCRAPSTEPACAGPPALLAACSTENQDCYFCADGRPVARQCARGQWREGALRVCR